MLVAIMSLHLLSRHFILLGDRVGGGSHPISTITISEVNKYKAKYFHNHQTNVNTVRNLWPRLKVT